MLAPPLKMTQLDLKSLMRQTAVHITLMLAQMHEKGRKLARA
jgi:hypothetical protein